MIPGLTLILGYNQHVYQAAAMITNVAVSIPAAMRHHGAGTLVMSRLRWMMPAALVTVVIGVWLSNLSFFRGPEGGRWLGRLLAMFLVYVIANNVRRLWQTSPRETDPDPVAAVASWRYASVGSVMGTIAGLLGIGGGALAVPLQHACLRLPFRACIANSSTLICVTATVGAVYKNASLDLHGHHWRESFTLALLLAPSCWLGGHLGAVMTHHLSLKYIRAAFIGLMVVAAVKMAAIPWGQLVG